MEMLNRMQLEDAARCCQNNCSECSNMPFSHGNGMASCAEQTAQTALKYRDMLERHVCHKRSSDGKEFCIECRNLREHGHAKSCELAVLLKEG